MGQRPRWRHILEASKDEARLAVDLYNRSADKRSLEAFVVHMHMAWQLLLHARFERDHVDYRYWDGRKLERIDGDVKTWDLARCLREVFDDNDPVRRNVEFFIGLRNKIEHRYEQLLADLVAGKTQAHLMNYEDTLTTTFGATHGLADELRFPVFLSNLTPTAVDVLKRVHRRLPKRIVTYIREYDGALPDEVSGDWRYDFRVFLLPQSGPKTEADAVMRFVREEDMTDEQKQARDVVQTIVRTKQVPVQNKGKYKPTAVADKVQAAIGARFMVSDHTSAWKHFKVRPPRGAEHPEVTDSRYCVWDEPHGDHLYTDAWVRKLSKCMANPVTYKAVTGRRLRRRST
jgi:hypothetical protein